MGRYIKHHSAPIVIITGIAVGIISATIIIIVMLIPVYI